MQFGRNVKKFVFFFVLFRTRPIVFVRVNLTTFNSILSFRFDSGVLLYDKINRPNERCCVDYLRSLLDNLSISFQTKRILDERRFFSTIQYFCRTLVSVSEYLRIESIPFRNRGFVVCSVLFPVPVLEWFTRRRVLSCRFDSTNFLYGGTLNSSTRLFSI